MSEVTLKLFQKPVVSLTQTLNLRCSSGVDGRVELKPPTQSSVWGAKENLSFRFFADASSVRVEIYTAKQADNYNNKKSPHLGAKVPTDACLKKFGVRCARCLKELYNTQLLPQELELPFSKTISWDFPGVFRYACHMQDIAPLTRQHSSVTSRNVSGLGSRSTSQNKPSFEKSVIFIVVLDSYKIALQQTTASLKVLQKLHDENIHADVTLYVDKSELRAHRCVLATYSPVLKSMLEVKTEGLIGDQLLDELALKDVRVEVMEAALLYMYGKEPIESIDTKTRMDLLALAERFQMRDLKERCERVLCQDASADPLELLALADIHDAQILMAAIVEKIVGHPDKNKILSETCTEDFISTHPKVVKKLFKKL